MKKVAGLLFLSIFLISDIQAQEKKTKKSFLSGMYLQWGWNTEWYTKSTLHFQGAVNGIPHDFTVYDATAHDRIDFDGTWKKPLEITVPQFNWRIGFYLNEAHTQALEINFDHTKYIMDDNQTLRVKGTIGNRYIDKDTLVAANDFLSFEHTNGANFLHFNYVEQHAIKTKNDRTVFSYVWKAGAGFMIPKTDVTMFGKRLDNEFNIAGYCVSAEAGLRWYPLKNLFLEGTMKSGFANYTNAQSVDGGKAQHSFGYFELIGTVGYDIKF